MRSSKYQSNRQFPTWDFKRREDRENEFKGYLYKSTLCNILTWDEAFQWNLMDMSQMSGTKTKIPQIWYDVVGLDGREGLQKK